MPPAPAKKPTGRKPGGQPGHPPQLKRRLPSELVSNTVTHIPKTCEHCQAALPQVAGTNDREPSWHEIVELRPVLVTVTEYQRHGGIFRCCGQSGWEAVPEAGLAHGRGPSLRGSASVMCSE